MEIHIMEIKTLFFCNIQRIFANICCLGSVIHIYIYIGFTVYIIFGGSGVLAFVVVSFSVMWKTELCRRPHVLQMTEILFLYCLTNKHDVPVKTGSRRDKMETSPLNYPQQKQCSQAPAMAPFTVSMTLIWLLNLRMMHLCGSYQRWIIPQKWDSESH